MTFANRRWPVPAFTGDWKQDKDIVLKAINDYWLDLEKKDALSIDEATIRAARGIKFPATAVAQTDVNTLDDYIKKKAWTPVLTFATPGTLAVTYATQAGSYTKIGSLVVAHFNIATSGFTLGTAAGALEITGLPYTAAASPGFFVGSLFWNGITTTTVDIDPYIGGGTSIIKFAASKSATAAADIVAADTPTGGTIRLTGSICFEV